MCAQAMSVCEGRRRTRMEWGGGGGLVCDMNVLDNPPAWSDLCDN